MMIGLIGGNSQVGSSVAHYLSNYLDVKVKCFVRSSYSQIFFDLLRIPYEQIDLADIDGMKVKFRECSAIIDFSYPSGQLQDIPVAIAATLTNVISAMQPGTSFVYMSSIMAFGIHPNEKHIKNYRFSRSSYSAIKRKAERKCLSLGKKFSVHTYNFRLGQVHGFLQSVNSSFREKLKSDKVVFIDGHRDDLTNVVFINVIGNAIVEFSKGKHRPGTYTLVNHPQWTLSQLYLYYLDFYNIKTSLYFVPHSLPKAASFYASVLSRLKKYRPVLESIVLLRLPRLSTKIKGKYRENEMAKESESSQMNKAYIDYNLLGKPPGKLVESSSSTYDEVWEIEKRMESKYIQLIQSGKI